MRLELTRKTDLGLKALQALAQGPGKGAVLARGIGSTGHFLPQVLAPLVKAGWVRSEPGPRGGYRLIGSLDDISLLDLIEAVEGPASDGRCVLRNTTCPSPQHCALHEPWTRARQALIDELGRTSLARITTKEEYR